MDEYEAHPKIVAATKGGKTEYWAITCLREDAVDAIRDQLEPGWVPRLTEARLPIETALALKMARRSIRKLPAGTKFL